ARAGGAVPPRAAGGARRGRRADEPDGREPPPVIEVRTSAGNGHHTRERAGGSPSLETLRTDIVGTESPPPLPDLSVVAAVVRLAEAADSERHAQRPSGDSICLGDDLDR